MEARRRGRRGLRAWVKQAALGVGLWPAAEEQASSVDLDTAAAALNAGKRDVGFVQVGAFDGRANDPLYDQIMRHGWRGVLVEPQPEAFKRLQQTYAEVEGLVLLNAAVGARRGHMTLWRVAGHEPDDPWWAGQIASFDRDHLFKHIGDDTRLARRVTGDQVETIPIKDVVVMSPRSVDVLQVDAEGFDGRIVRSLDLTLTRPGIVRYEHRHLRAVDRARTMRYLVRHGYRVAINEEDTIAVLGNGSTGATATE